MLRCLRCKSEIYPFGSIIIPKEYVTIRRYEYAADCRYLIIICTRDCDEHLALDYRSDVPIATARLEQVVYATTSYIRQHL